MDEIDKRILTSLLGDGRSTLRQISKNLGISPQSLQYRLNKFQANNIIKKFALYVDKRIYNIKSGFAAFSGLNIIETGIFAKILCLEEISLYGFQGKTLDELRASIDAASEKIGPKAMEYIPEQNINITVSGNELAIIESLKSNPRISYNDLASQLCLPAKRIKKYIENLIKKSIISVIPVIDISKTDITVFAIFSENFDLIEPLLKNNIFFTFKGRSAGLAICFADNLLYAKKIINMARSHEKNASVMVIYDYDFF